MFDAKRGAQAGTAADVWLTDLKQPEAVVDDFDTLLSATERARARCLRSLVHRHRYIVAHASLRCILACYTGDEPAMVRFELGPQRRPSLAGADGQGWDFSLSHSGELAVVGVTLCGPIGIDLECIDARRRIDLLAPKILPPEEAERLLVLPPCRRITEFHRAWTRFEAAAKASGNGISALSAARDGHLLSRWHLTEFRLRGYVGALCLPTPPGRILWRSWRPDGCNTLVDARLRSAVSLPGAESLCLELAHGSVESGGDPRGLVTL